MGKFVWPVPSSGRISSPFGYRTPPTKGASSFHDGIDISAASGAPILAIGPGIVTVSGWVSGYGNYVKIQHSGGLESFYGHCRDTPLVRVGASVAAGQKIAVVGSTGISTGPHLHLGIHANGAKVNPSNYVSYTDTLENYTGLKGNAVQSASGQAESANAGGLSELTAQKSAGLTSVAVRSVSGKTAAQSENIRNLSDTGTGLELFVENDRIYKPVLAGRVILERPRKGGPATLKFSVVRDESLNFQEGNPVSLRWQGEKAFFGYVFSKSRRDADTIDVTCYDQIRYLKNRDTLSYTNKTYTELLRMLADDYHLNCGTLEDTGYKIGSRIEECSLLDMLGNASDDTVVNTGQLFVLYDDCGALCLRNIQNMKLPILLDAEGARSYDYKSTIDENVYNRVKLAVDNSAAGLREAYVFNSEENQVRWGMLQYYEKLDDGAGSAQILARAEQLLEYYNQKQRSLKITGTFGDLRVRGGSSVLVRLNLGDLDVEKYMLVEEVRHIWETGDYTMDLTLSGIHSEKTPVTVTMETQTLPENEVTPASGAWYSAADLRIVAVVIYNEAGYGCTDRHMELVGAVIYNRVKSSLFPNTVYGVVTQKGQYSVSYAQENSYYTQRAMASEKWTHCLELAKKALDGQVICPANVVYQSNFASLGSGYYEVHKTSYSTTYFAYA